MSFTFHNDAIGRPLDAVRTELGDTVEETHLVEDEMIQYCLLDEGDDILRAAAKAAELTGALFAREEVVRHSGFSIDKSAAQAHFSNLANTLRARIASPEDFIMNTRRASKHRDNERNSSFTHGLFRRGMFGWGRRRR